MKLPKSGDGTGDSMLPVPSPFQRVKSVHLFFPLSHPRPPFLVKNRQTHTYINFTTTALSSHVGAWGVSPVYSSYIRGNDQ